MANRSFAMLCSGYGRGIINLIKNKSKLKHKIKLIICPEKSEDLISLAKKNEICFKFIDSNLNLNQKNDLVLNLLEEFNIDYLFLIGCTFRIKKRILQKYNNKVINIHPSILPSFKGLNAIDQAINYGVKVSGISTHFANEDFDCGKIIQQKCIRIEGLSFEQIDKKFVNEGIDLSIQTINSLN